MITNMTHDEKIALAGILKWVVSADHEDSLDGMESFFKDNNWGDFKAIYQEMDDKFDELQQLKEFLSKIDNKDVQQTIKDIAKDVMISDVVITNEEQGILDFLQEIWGK